MASPTKIYVAAAVIGVATLGGFIALVSRPSGTTAGSTTGLESAVPGSDVTLPAWTRQPLAREAGLVILVGASGVVDAERDGLELAQADAIRRLVGAVLTDMPEGVAKAYATNHITADSAHPVPPAELRSLATRFLRVAGTTSTPERVDVVVKHVGQRVEIHARYSLAEEAFRSAVSAYSRTVKLNGVTMATLFPLVRVGVEQERDVVVVDVDAAARSQGIAVGDFILRVDDRPVPNLQALAALTTRSKSYSLLVESGGISKNVRLAH